MLDDALATGARDGFLLSMMASDGAMNQPEYVVATVPASIVNANPLNTSPPKRNSASTAMNTVPEVITVRVNVWFKLVLMADSSGSRRCSRVFSRTRSKITIMSFIEYPTIVSMAAMTLSVIS